VRDICLEHQVDKLSNGNQTDFELESVLSQLHYCKQRFNSGRCNCGVCWIPAYYGFKRTLFNEVVIDEKIRKYLDSSCNKGVLGKIIPQSYPERADFVNYKLDFSHKNPMISQKFIPSITADNKTHYWQKVHSADFIVSVLPQDLKCSRAVEENGGRFIVTGVLKDSLEVRTSDFSYINKVLGIGYKPYAVLPIERSLYLDDPPFLSAYVLFEYLNSFKLYDISGLNLIPLIIGSTNEQIRLCCNVLKSWGFKTVAWSVSGLNKAHKPLKIKQTYSLFSSYFEQVVMVNFLSFQSFYQKAVFVSPDWYLLPYRFGRRAYGLHGAICSCEFCKGRYESAVSQDDLALCSLSRVFSLFDNNLQTNMEKWLCLKE
jgi:hypothetical protein